MRPPGVTPSKSGVAFAPHYNLNRTITRTYPGVVPRMAVTHGHLQEHGPEQVQRRRDGQPCKEGICLKRRAWSWDGFLEGTLSHEMR